MSVSVTVTLHGTREDKLQMDSGKSSILKDNNSHSTLWFDPEEPYLAIEPFEKLTSVYRLLLHILWEMEKRNTRSIFTVSEKIIKRQATGMVVCKVFTRLHSDVLTLESS